MELGSIPHEARSAAHLSLHLPNDSQEDHETEPQTGPARVRKNKEKAFVLLYVGEVYLTYICGR
jgi:hypothetical protein